MKIKTVDVAKSAKVLQESLSKESPTPVVVTRDGEPVAVLVPTFNADLESISLSLNPKFIAIIEESRRSVAENGGIPASEVEAMFAEDLGDQKSA
jgi:hypothetical protein